VRLMHVVVIHDNEDPLVTGFFLDELQAKRHAHQILCTGDPVPRDLDAWCVENDVQVTRFVAAHAPTGVAGRRAAA
jgi:hypothetical protein